MRKKTKKVATAKDEAKPAHSFIRSTDFSKKKIGFPNMHVTIAMEAMRHAEKARAGKNAIAGYFKDLDRIIADGKKAGSGVRLHDAMVATMSYCAQILACGEQVSLHEHEAHLGLDHIGQFVDMKQVKDTFLAKTKRAVVGTLNTRPRRRRR